MRAGNKIRHTKALSKGLCIACLRRECRLKSEKNKIPYKCYFKSKWLACKECSKEHENKNHSDWTNSVLVCNRHEVEATKTFLKQLERDIGYDSSLTTAFITMPGIGNIGNDKLMLKTGQEYDTFMKTDVKGKRGTFKKKETKKDQDGDKISPCGEIDGHEERDTKVVFNSYNGDVSELTSEFRVKNESTEDTLYFFQAIQLAGCVITLFYDDGANIGIIAGKIAQELRLEILTRCPQSVSGAANMVCRSRYGKYGMNIGPLEDGSYQNISLIGLPSITNSTPVYELGELVTEALKFNKDKISLIPKLYSRGESVVNRPEWF